MSELKLDSLITNTCSYVFSMLNPLIHTTDVSKMPEDLRQRVEDAMLALERQAYSEQINSEHTRAIKFALSAYADEIIMSSTWEGKYQWMGNPLCVSYFGQTRAGEHFFELLNEMLEEPAANIGLLRLYYQCMQLGYQGKYRLQDYDNLLALMDMVRRKLDKVSQEIPSRLADRAVPEALLVNRIASSKPMWAMLALSVLCVAGLLFTYSHRTQSALQQSAATIEALIPSDQ